MGVGTKEIPFVNPEGMGLAEELVRGVFAAPGGGQGVFSLRDGGFLTWGAGRWTKVDRRAMVNRVMRELHGAWFKKRTSDGDHVVEMEAGSRVAEEVVRGIEALTEGLREGGPRWVGGEEKTEAGTSIGFLDVVVDVGGGEVKVVERDAGWLDPYLVPTTFEAKAECPVWRRCLEEWSGGDPQWVELAQRVVGMLLMGHRRYHKMPLVQGLGRGGKSTFMGVVRRLLGGGYFATDVQRLATDFGWENARGCKVVGIEEAHSLVGHDGEKVAGNIKRVLSGDPIEVNQKGVKASPNVVIHAPVVMVSNPIPKLPNHGEAISGKMLVLAFNHSWLGKEDFGLEEKLAAEVAGIAAWAVEGARKLEGEKEAGKKWPTTESGEKVLAKYRLLNNVWDAFLEARFVRDPKGYVLEEIVREEWESWVEENGVREHVPKYHMMPRLESEASWRVVRAQAGSGEERGKRVLRGVSMKRLE